MKISHLFATSQLILLLSSCSPSASDNQNLNNQTKEGKARSTKLATYQEVPLFIKTYLNSLEEGNFLIADTGEAWASGCNQQEGKPCRQFISGTLQDKKFQMEYWQGGIALQKQIVVMDLEGNDIKNYSLKNK